MATRTTIVMDEELLQAVKARAAERGWSLSRAITEFTALGMHLHISLKEAPGEFRWETFRGSIRPGVDLNDRDRLYEKMEGRA